MAIRIKKVCGLYATVIEKEPQNSISAYSLWYAYCILNKRTGEENKAASHGLETYFKKKQTVCQNIQIVTNGFLNNRLSLSPEG